ncbi:MAG: amino acid adenylation domain-containing protein [Chloroflexota bacterium]|nr:amino acid adenylation domain-containing protein [Chloroflexota bacterium]
MSDLFEPATALSAGEKRALLAQLLKKRARAPRTFPLSFAQQRLWFMDQWEPGSTLYNMPTAIQITGPLRIAVLEQSINEIVRRHEALRTTFMLANGQPVQVIVHDLALALPVVHVPRGSKAEQEAEIRSLIQQEIQQSFDLAQGPLLRIRLLCLADNEYILLLTMHHIISDGWSMGLFFQELSAIYAAYVHERPSPLAALPIQYVDFSQWQREWLQGPVLEKQLSYWKEQLAGAPAMLQMPLDHLRPATQSFRGSRHLFTLDKALTEQLKALSNHEEGTLFMTLLAAFQVLLYRYSGQEDILVGTPIANRNRTELEQLIGFFVNNLVLRTDLAGNPAFRSLLKRVREVTLGAYAHQDIPFEKLVEELEPERDLSRNPLFQIMFSLQNTLRSDITLTDLAVQPLEIDSGTARFDIILLLEENEQGLSGTFGYSTDLFDASTIARMAGHYRTLLEAIVRNPDQQIAALPLLAPAEREHILLEWNRTEAPYSRDTCIHELFEAQVQRSPAAPAVLFEGQQLTYLQLNQQANQVAHHLKALGIGPGAMVAIYMERSLEMIPALLGILKAGATYISLETSFPLVRVQWILSSLHITTLITRSTHYATLQQLAGLEHSIFLDSARTFAPLASGAAIWTREHLAHLAQENLPRQGTPEDIAYIIFTSGSTGTPKGVMVRHFPVINLIEWVNTRFNIRATDRVLFITSLCFDLSVYDVFGLLAAGGSIRVVSSEDIHEPERLLEILHTEPITFWDSAPAALQQLVPFFQTNRDPQRRDSLRLVFLSGDWIPVKLPDAVRTTFPGVEVVSLGGATEATIWSNFYRIGAVSPQWLSIPYGKPIQNAQYYVLDSYLNPCPVGVAGDLYIGGDCLASGYINEPELTAQKFLPDPFTGRAGQVLYRTGDMARFWPDGNIEFLGRLDTQVKIRGYRIELGEIEAVLVRHPAVQVAVVDARRDGSGEKSLVAYLVPQHGQVPAIRELRAFLQDQLPEYMIPLAFVVLDELPVTLNGKLDRRKLPDPHEYMQAESEEQDAAPMTPIEELLVSIWSGVLGIARVGIHDNFFDIGGHSLLATQLISRIRTTFSIELPLRYLFETPTVETLAARVEEACRAEHALQPLQITVCDRHAAFPLSFGQQRLWFLHQLEPENVAYNIPAALRLSGMLNLAVLERSLNEIVRRHEVLRTTYSIEDGQAIQVIAPLLTIALPVVDMCASPLDEQEHTIQELTTREGQQPFDLVHGPLLRARLFRWNATQHVLITTMHHSISDGWSFSLFFRELTALYKAYVDEQPSPLLALPIQYKDFALWQREWLQGEVLEKQLTYWTQHLKGAPTALNLPTDRPRPAIQTFRGERHTFLLPADMVEKLQALSRREEVTLFMTLLAAFQTLLFRYSGQDDLLVGTPIANRTHAEIEDVIGLFVNTLVLRTQLSGNPSFRELLKRVREVALGGYVHQDLPFEKLVEVLQPKRDLSRNPLFQVMFVYQNALLLSQAIPDLTFQLVRVGSGTEQFDITLAIVETEEGLLGRLDYNIDLFDAATIIRMAQHFQTLLQAVGANAEQRISELPLLAEAERQQLLHEWNSVHVYPQIACMHERFEAQEERTPNAIAAVFEQESLTYAALNRRANQLAHHLQAAGVGPEVRVGLCMERSLDVLVGLLGILKAGGAYVPLDVAYPEERLAFLLADAHIPVLVTQPHLHAHVPAHLARIVDVSSDNEALAQECSSNPHSGVTVDNLAYVIYTSGSTGKPKGTLITHAHIGRLFDATEQVFAFNERDVWTLFHSYAFDFSVWELWGAWLYGGRLVVVPYWVSRSADAFYDLLIHERVTVLNQTPSAFRQLMQVDALADIPYKLALRWVIFGGEALDIHSLAPWFERHGDHAPQLVNMYGITETTVHVTQRVLTKEDADQHTSGSMIGTPIADLRTYILDASYQLLPTGVPGELYVGGAGPARGYLGRPELTAERFLPDPFSTEPGARLYKTGDLARYHADGNIEYLGRIDAQIKLRGFRIEPGEIEAVLTSHPRVWEALVLVREDTLGEKRLIAYMGVDDPQTLSESELRHFLKERLPDYMIPGTFVMLSHLPQTSNGKVDRRALPEPEVLRPALEAGYVAPRTAIEQSIATIWQELLHIEKVGTYDNFFDLGGHSLLMLHIQRRLQALLKRDISVIELFQYPSVSALAEHLVQQQQPKAETLPTSQKRAELRKVSMRQQRDSRHR